MKTKSKLVGKMHNFLILEYVKNLFKQPKENKRIKNDNLVYAENSFLHKRSLKDLHLRFNPYKGTIIKTVQQ